MCVCGGGGGGGGRWTRALGKLAETEQRWNRGLRRCIVCLSDCSSQLKVCVCALCHVCWYSYDTKDLHGFLSRLDLKNFLFL